MYVIYLKTLHVNFNNNFVACLHIHSLVASTLTMYQHQFTLYVIHMINVSMYRYGDAVMELDYGVGQILNTLVSLGIDKNTLVIFSSDNGGATYAKEQGLLISLSLFFLFAVSQVVNCPYFN